MSTPSWVVLSSVLVSAISLIGSTALLLTAKSQSRILPVCVSFAAGSLLGGALLLLVLRILFE